AWGRRTRRRRPGWRWRGRSRRRASPRRAPSARPRELSRCASSSWHGALSVSAVGWLAVGAASVLGADAVVNAASESDTAARAVAGVAVTGGVAAVGLAPPARPERGGPAAQGVGGGQDGGDSEDREGHGGSFRAVFG